uniref:Na+/H+ antiporter n=1 Tax=uncultured Nocardioidaceae bacterium TaxID=253824 RepID=A0A6J4M9B7_9ACTN|nr:MAG: Na+/H+ antiporter [uncultured Nocardioidaceae bacterium]
MIDTAGAVYTAAGVAALAAALLPRYLSKAPVSMPMVFVAAGVLGFTFVDALPYPDPLSYGPSTVHLTELCVIISLMGAGLALDRPVGWRRWGSTWRLLGITMPLSILVCALLGWWLLGLGVAGALLLGAVLAPTDPVLAGEVKVGEPAVDPEDHEDEARFSLTSEAGLNDGLAFPFVYAAVAISLSGVAPGGWLADWLLVDVAWRLAIGVLTGLAAGWLLSRLFFLAPWGRARLAEQAEGFVALAATLLAYGVAELAHGYGFLAVFVCACSIRAAERSHAYHGVLHSFVEQLERLLTVVVLILFGGAVARGLLDSVGIAEVALAAAVLLVVRPVTGWLGLAGGRTGTRERWVIAAFGVRGIGSLYYAAYALEEGSFSAGEQLWAVVGLVVLGSVVLHGVSATPVMAMLDHRREQVGGKRASTTPV